PAGFILPVGNACALVGITLYWRAIRRFCRLPDVRWLFLPAAVATIGVYVYSGLSPSLAGRIVVASSVWVIISIAIALTLYRQATDVSVSRQVLAAIFIAIGVFMLMRIGYFIAYPHAAASFVDGASWVNVVTPLLVAVPPVIGTTAFLMMCSERIRRQWELAAATDYLTGLPNRRTITGTGEARFNAAKRTGSNFAVAIIDIDHFKSINDRYGHDTGDIALKHVAAILEQNCRGPNMVGRQGGEEFVALLEVNTPAEATAAAERLRQAIESATMRLNNSEIRITASIGVGVIAAEDRVLDDLLRRADQALYAAKAGGRNRVESIGVQ
ncbi:MAG: GGDEF domain-containing protein, partial [Betaproteobacteria bacterium]|nr:GGDEF domain-containing protein [Betaproteobacteria bacterium]